MNLVLVALLPAAAAVSRVRPIAESRKDRTMIAVNVLGETFLAGREMQIDIDFPTGRSGRGELFILYEPVSGLFYRTYAWLEKDYPKSAWLNSIQAHSRVGVGDGRLVIVSFTTEQVGIVESTEKASSLDDAEARSLEWVGTHLAEVEAKSGRDVDIVPLGLGAFPSGFFLEAPYSWPPPVNVLGMVRNGQAWDLTLESSQTHKRAIATLVRRDKPVTLNLGQYSQTFRWGVGSILPQDELGRK